MNRRAVPWPGWGLAAVLLATLWAFAPALHAGFFNLDDYRYLTAIRPFTPAQVAHLFTHAFEGYHPLSLLSLGLTFQAVGFDGWTHHALNVALHLLNTGLVYALILRLFARRELALLTAAVFGLHPIHVEAVAWVTSRKDVLYAAFYLLALLQYVAYARGHGRRHYGACLVLMLASVLAKGMAVSFPLAALAIDYALGRGPLWARLREKIPLFAMAAVFGIVSIRAQQASGYVPELADVGTSWAARLLLVLQAFAHFTWHLVDIRRLAAFHPYPAGTAAVGWAAAGALMALFLGCVVLAGWRRWPVVVFALLFFLATIVLVLQVIPVADFVAADRYDYLASIGFALLIAAGIERAAAGGAGQGTAAAAITRGLPRGLAVCYALVLGAATYAYALLWQDAGAVWTHVLQRHPQAVFALNMRGCALNDVARYAEALRDFDQAAALNPSYPRTYLNRGFAREKQGDMAGALADCEAFLVRRPRDPLGHNNLGLLLLRGGRAAEALAAFEAAVALAPPNHASAPVFLGNRAEARLALRDWPGAVADASAAIARLPTHFRAHLTRAQAQWQLGHRREAAADVAAAEAIDPRDPAIAALRAGMER